jgi:hypothetical protein
VAHLNKYSIISSFSLAIDGAAALGVLCIVELDTNFRRLANEKWISPSKQLFLYGPPVNAQFRLCPTSIGSAGDLHLPDPPGGDRWNLEKRLNVTINQLSLNKSSLGSRSIGSVKAK